jgi:hypothetical protein
MKYQDFLNEEQLDELGILKNVQAAWKGAQDGGIKGAVSGYKAQSNQNKGEEHSSKIVANLKAEFMKTVGGGNPPTYQNLIDFLSSHGLGELDSIPDPSKATNEPVEPKFEPEPPSAAPAGPAVDTSHPADDNPNINLGMNEAIGGGLSNPQIDQIIQSAVQKNYAKIVAAQKGRSLPSGGVSVSGTNSATAQSSMPNTTATNPFSDPGKLIQQWSAYVAAGGQVNKKIKRLIKAMSASMPQAAVAPKAKPEVAPTPKPEVAPAPTGPTQAELDADHERMASGSNESIGYSRFLGMKL